MQTNLTSPIPLDRQLATEEEALVCDFCSKGRLIQFLQELKLKQWTEKGDVHFRAMLKVGICDHCGGKSLEPGSDRVLDEAFQQAYGKLQ